MLGRTTEHVFPVTRHVLYLFFLNNDIPSNDDIEVTRHKTRLYLFFLNNDIPSNDDIEVTRHKTRLYLFFF